MQGPKVLLEHEDHWVTDMGAWFTGERVVFRGKDLFHELQDMPWMGLLLYGITGRMPSEKQIKLFDGIWSLSTSYPDPRLWNNRVAALAGTVRSTASLGMGAAIAVSEATIYGRRPDIRSIDFLLRTQKQLDQKKDLTDWIREELKKHRGIAGFGRPLTAKDERIEPLLKLAKKLGYANGNYVSLAFQVESALQKGRFRFKMNVASLAAALVADQGMNSREYYYYSILSFSGGILLSFLDSQNQKEGCFFPQCCDRIQYEGKNHRSWR